MDEFALIRRYFQRPAAVEGIRIGIGDDAAVLTPPAGHELAISSDTLIAGRHFPPDTPPTDIGWKALAVNLSDLAAMGAQPAAFLLNLSLPAADESFLKGFASGLFELADRHRVALAGGDTTRGALSISITALGWLPAGQALQRSGARPGDVVCVFGELGAPALALEHWPGGDSGARQRLLRPEPQVALGQRLLGHASACIDISDGLAADLAHILEASGCGARVAQDALPVAAALRDLPVAEQLNLMLHGGDEYLLCATLSEDALVALQAGDAGPVFPIGRIEGVPGMRLEDATGKIRTLSADGYRHF